MPALVTIQAGPFVLIARLEEENAPGAVAVLRTMPYHIRELTCT
jgi:hypothetical protein